LEWEYNGFDHNLKCINCAQRYFDTWKDDALGKIATAAEWKAMGQQRAA
jgi:hypothetical protein